jgi:hypothetical protein
MPVAGNLLPSICIRAFRRALCLNGITGIYKAPAFLVLLLSLVRYVNSILYGNLRVEILGEVGSRVDRLALRAPPDLILRKSQEREHGPELMGRSEQLGVVRHAVRARCPVEFFAACGYGKTTLLRHVAANAAVEGLAGSSVYLRAGPGGLEDLLHRLVGELYVANQPVKLTPGQYAQILGHVQTLVALDDVAFDPGQVDHLLRTLPGCVLVFGSQRPTLGRHGSSLALAGLPGGAAIELVTRELGRPLTSGELAACEQLITAVDGQPLHLRQAAALVRENGLPLRRLAAMAGRDPESLDRLSVSRLAGQERRALAVLALAAGALLPAELVGAMGDIAMTGESLGRLHRRGLAEQHADRFGLPICKTAGYRQMLLKDLHLAAALRELADWLANSGPTTADSLSGAGAALAIIEWAAERGDWPTVVRLVRVAEPILTLAGRWEASRHILTTGMQAATAAGHRAAEALFAHQQGTLAFCQDELADAQHLLQHALELRERLNDHDGAAVTRHNLRLLQPPPPPPPPTRAGRPPRKAALLAGSVLTGLIVLTTGIVKATSPHTLPHQLPVAATSPTPTHHHRHHGRHAGQQHNHGGDGRQHKTGNRGPGHNGGGHQPLKPPIVQAADLGQANITPGHLPATGQVKVTNPNTQPLRITGAQAAAPFTITQGTCAIGTLVPAQASCDFTVQFAPTALGASMQTLTVDSAAGPATAQLSGTGFIDLTITVNGSGAGTVQGNDGFTCAPPDPTGCTDQVTSPITLTETPTNDPQSSDSNVFAGWGGACVGSGANPACELQQITADSDVSAQFDFHVG